MQGHKSSAWRSVDAQQVSENLLRSRPRKDWNPGPCFYLHFGLRLRTTDSEALPPPPTTIPQSSSAGRTGSPGSCGEGGWGVGTPGSPREKGTEGVDSWIDLYWCSVMLSISTEYLVQPVYFHLSVSPHLNCVFLINQMKLGLGFFFFPIQSDYLGFLIRVLTPFKCNVIVDMIGLSLPH